MIKTCESEWMYHYYLNRADHAAMKLAELDDFHSDCSE